MQTELHLGVDHRAQELVTIGIDENVVPIHRLLDSNDRVTLVAIELNPVTRLELIHHIQPHSSQADSSLQC